MHTRKLIRREKITTLSKKIQYNAWYGWIWPTGVPRKIQANVQSCYSGLVQRVNARWLDEFRLDDCISSSARLQGFLGPLIANYCFTYHAVLKTWKEISIISFKSSFIRSYYSLFFCSDIYPNYNIYYRLLARLILWLILKNDFLVFQIHDIILF